MGTQCRIDDRTANNFLKDRFPTLAGAGNTARVPLPDGGVAEVPNDNAPDNPETGAPLTGREFAQFLKLNPEVVGNFCGGSPAGILNRLPTAKDEDGVAIGPNQVFQDRGPKGP